MAMKTDNVRQLRDRAPDTEKVTLNLGYIDLGRIDLLVQEGFYGNRSDFIRSAIRNQLTSHAPEVARSIDRHMLELGLREFGAAELEAARTAGETLHLRVLGLVRFGADVTPALVLATIGSMTVLGAVHASPEVKAALAARIR
jgi:Arc/MetJ-type ribon-helix-helix transcriptional regulator